MINENETQGPLFSSDYQGPDHCAWTDPMCPDPMEKGSMFCGTHRIAARQDTLRKIIGRYFEMLHGKIDDTTAEGSAEQDLRQERIDSALQLIDLVAGHPLPEKLVNQAADEQALRPGQVIAIWGKADRVTENGIAFGVDGPCGYPVHLVIEDGELRLRQDRSGETTEVPR